MNKDFEQWNTLKKELDERSLDVDLFCLPQDIWMCAIGVNIGSEQDGQGSLYSRPVLVLRLVDMDTFLGIPITTQCHRDVFHFKFNLGGVDQYALLLQIRLLSMKRLLRFISKMPDHIYSDLLGACADIIPKRKIPQEGGL